MMDLRDPCRRCAPKAYAVLADIPWAAAPDIPTVDAAGVPGLYMPFWHGLWVPRGTPKEAVAKLNAAVIDALADPTARQRYAQLGQEIFPRERQTPEALGALDRPGAPSHQGAPRRTILL
jgi:tripartite-type tricarboxylate transporter receptor subunit TctC